MCTSATQTLSDESFKSAHERNETYRVALSQIGFQQPTRVCHTNGEKMRSWQLLSGIYLNTTLCLQIPSSGRPGGFWH